uniref:LOW QUALITY PROTEIN: uncharacterized protein LOC109967683 n=1 Tax=Monopterus albus TaxID=43700 RepID=UPI0009B3C823
YDVTSLFTCIPTTEAIRAVKKRLLKDDTLNNRTSLTPDHACTLLELCLNTTYFQFRQHFYRQHHGCAMGSPVSPIVANLYMEEIEKKALASFTGTAPSHWFRYVDDAWVKIRTQEVEAFTKHINLVDNNIKFTREDARDDCLAFLDCAVHLGGERSLQVEVYRKPTHTDQYLLFDSHHPLQHKLGVIRTLNHKAEVPTTAEGAKKEKLHIQNSLKACGYSKWAFTKARNTNREKPETRRDNTVIPYVAGLSEKLKRIFRNHNIPVNFKPGNTLWQRLVHPKDKTPRHKQSDVVYAIKCSQECNNLYTVETKQALHKHMAQHRRAYPGRPESAVYLHLKDKGHSFEDTAKLAYQVPSRLDVACLGWG